jgi:hypothetical protein
VLPLILQAVQAVDAARRAAHVAKELSNAAAVMNCNDAKEFFQELITTLQET